MYKFMCADVTNCSYLSHSLLQTHSDIHLCVAASHSVSQKLDIGLCCELFTCVSRIDLLMPRSVCKT